MALRVYANKTNEFMPYPHLELRSLCNEEKWYLEDIKISFTPIEINAFACNVCKKQTTTL